MTEQAARKAVEEAADLLSSKREQADDFLSPKQVEDEYPFKRQTLAQWRWMGLGPAYIKTGTSKSARIKYRRSAIEKWLDEHTVETEGAAA